MRARLSKQKIKDESIISNVKYHLPKSIKKYDPKEKLKDNSIYTKNIDIKNIIKDEKKIPLEPIHFLNKKIKKELSIIKIGGNENK